MKKSLLAAACMVVVALGWSGVAHAQRIPEPIAEREVERFAELLDLTDDQRAIASTIWSVYREDYFAGPLERIRAIHARERAAIEEIRDRSEVNGENPGTLAKEFYPPIMAEMAKLAAEVLEFEDQHFFQNLASILSEEQTLRMERVRLRRDLTIASRNITNFELPEGNINLSDQLEALPLSEDVRAKIESEFIPTYEARLLELLRASAAARWQRDVGLWNVNEVKWVIQNRPQDMNDPVLLRLRDRYFRLNSAAGEPLVVAKNQVVEHNRAALVQLSELLPAPAFRDLQGRIRRISYPKIWPDAGSVEVLFRAAMSREDLADGIRAGVVGMHQEWAQRHEVISIEMAEQRMQEWIGGQRGGMEAMHDSTRAREELESLGHQREALNRAQQELLEKMLPPEILADLPLRDWERDPPPRPWDPSDVARRKRAEILAEREAREERLKREMEEYERRRREQEQGGGDGD